MNLGQVYTKKIIADFMVGLLDLPANALIIDPCFGEGAFIRSLIDKHYSNVVGVEIDADTYRKVDFPCRNNYILINKDFFRYQPSSLVDGFILNPPYIRQEEIDKLHTVGITKEFIRTQCGTFEIYSKANLYIYFIARCITLLKDGGQMIAILPNVWLNTPDGKKFLSQVKSFGAIQNIVQVKGSPFVGNPLVDVMIIKFVKGVIGSSTMYNTLVVKDDSLELQNDSYPIHFESSDCVSLSEIANVRRGISTGFNKVFINPPVEDPNVLVDIVSTPKSIAGYNTAVAIFDKLLHITPSSKITDETVAYINNSELFILENGAPKTVVNAINTGKKWYSIVLPQPGQILFPYIIRGKARFILNDANVVARDNFYTISSTYDSLLLIALLNNYFIFCQLELCGKSYGKGLLKIQKYDMDNLVIPHPENLDDDIKKNLIKYSESLIKTGSERYIEEISKILSKYYRIDNIKAIYESLKNNRLTNEL